MARLKRTRTLAWIAGTRMRHEPHGIEETVVGSCAHFKLGMLFTVDTTRVGNLGDIIL